MLVHFRILIYGIRPQTVLSTKLDLGKQEAIAPIADAYRVMGSVQ